MQKIDINIININVSKLWANDGVEQNRMTLDVKCILTLYVSPQLWFNELKGIGTKNHKDFTKSQNVLQR